MNYVRLDLGPVTGHFANYLVDSVQREPFFFFFYFIVRVPHKNYLSVQMHTGLSETARKKTKY